MIPAPHTDRPFSLFYQIVSKAALTLGAAALVLLAIPVTLISCCAIPEHISPGLLKFRNS